MQLESFLQYKIHNIYQEFSTLGNDMITLESLQFHIIGEVLQKNNMTWNQLVSFLKTHTAIHPEVGKELIQLTQDEHSKLLVGQCIVPLEKLTRLVKQLYNKNNQTQMDALLAVDGLSGKISTFEPKHYIQNLKYTLSGAKSLYDEEFEFKRQHVHAVRCLYQELTGLGLKDRLAKYVYQVLRQVFMEETKIEFPTGEHVELSDDVMDKCKNMYKLTMGLDHIKEMVKSLKIRGEKRVNSEDAKPNEKIAKEE